MPGANCKIYGCSVSRKAQYKDISIFKVPKIQDEFHNRWRARFLSVVTRDRVVDGSLKRQIENDNIGVCELHFKPEEIIHHASRKSLVPGSIPTQKLPKKSIETSSRTNNEGRPSSAAVEEKRKKAELTTTSKRNESCYQSFEELSKRSKDLRLPEGWSIEITDGESILLQKREDLFEVSKIEVFINSNLKFRVRIYAWTLPANHLLYEKYESMANITVSNLVRYLNGCSVCLGVVGNNITYGNPVFIHHNVQRKHNYVEVSLHPLDQVEYLRSPTCAMIMLPEQEKASSCNSCSKLIKSEEILHKQKSRRLATPASLKAPLTLTSTSRLKLTIQQDRAKNKELQCQLERMREELTTKSLPVTSELESDLATIISRVDKSSMPPFMKLFWDEQQKYSKSSSKGIRYHPMIIRYCLGLVAKSPATYDDLRYDQGKGTGVLILPSRRRLRDYKNYIRPKQGFNHEIINELINKTKTFSEAERFVILSLDEMKIQEDLVWDKHTGELVGFVDLGDTELNYGNFKGKTETLASHVLVFLLRSVVNPIKFSLANFGTQSASSFQLFPLFWKAVSILELQCSLKVIAVTCDGASANRRFFKMHENLNTEVTSNTSVVHKVQNMFAVEDRFIYFIADPPHLMKTTRNCLHNSGSGKQSRFMWNDGQHILWRHIFDVYMEDQECGLHLLPKLTEDHMQLNSYSVMNVRFAVQVLSSAVAGVLQQFGPKEAAATSKFCSMMDTFFDCMNVRNLTEGHRKLKPFLQPYRSPNDNRFEWLQEFLVYLKSWKDSVSNRKGDFSDSERGKMFLSLQTYEGLQITCLSVIECVQFLLNNGVQYVLTERFCQDGLENYFGHQRSMGRRKDNPTLRDFGYNDNTIRNQREVCSIIGGNSKEEQSSSQLDCTPLPCRKRQKKL